LITEATANGLPPEFPTRRLCCVRFRNISEPVSLFELAEESTEKWLELKREYESAWRAFERADFISATRILGNLIRVYPEDGPTLVLLSRSVAALAESTNRPFHTRQSYAFNPVWDLEGE
jgi:hypothetical protein